MLQGSRHPLVAPEVELPPDNQGGGPFRVLLSQPATKLDAWYTAPGGVRMLVLWAGESESCRAGGGDLHHPIASKVLPGHSTVELASNQVRLNSWQRKVAGLEKITQLEIHSHRCPAPYSTAGAGPTGSNRVFGIRMRFYDSIWWEFGDFNDCEEGSKEILKYTTEQLGTGKVVGLAGRHGAALDQLKFLFESLPCQGIAQVLQPTVIDPLEADGASQLMQGEQNQPFKVKIKGPWNLDPIETLRVDDDNEARLRAAYAPKVLLVTVTAREFQVLQGSLSPPVHQDASVPPTSATGINSDNVIEAAFGNHTYLLGCLGKQNCIVVRAVGMGIAGMQAIIIVAASLWKPVWIFNVGIGWGAGPNVGDCGEKLGDVMVGIGLLGYGVNDKVSESETISRVFIPEIGPMLHDRLQAACVRWKPSIVPDASWYSNGVITGESPGCYQLLMGDIISVGVLLNNTEEKKRYLDRAHKVDHRKPIGGDMEAWGLYEGARATHCENWAMVKGICDWGDTAKNDGYQLLAMYNAVDVIRYMLQVRQL